MEGSTCPICDGETSPFFFRAAVPTLLNSLCKSLASAQEIPKGDLDYRLCKECGFLYNRAFNKALVPYDSNYELNATLSSRYHTHLSSILERCRHLAGTPARVLEIGCGQGLFLEHLARHLPLDFGIGFDPAWRGVPLKDPRLTLYQLQFNQSTVPKLPGPPGLVVSRHLLEHLPDPVGFLKELKALLPTPWRILLETPNADFTLAHHNAHELYYEHCSLFSQRALHTALHAAGFQSIQVQPAFGEEYLVAEGHAETSEDQSSPFPPLQFTPEQAGELQTTVEGWQRFIAERGRDGGIAVWGAAGKGATFTQLTDPDRTLIHCLIDINPVKSGSFVAGTGHRILLPEEAFTTSLATIVVVNENYLPEITTMSRSHGFTGSVVGIKALDA